MVLEVSQRCRRPRPLAESTVIRSMPSDQAIYRVRGLSLLEALMAVENQILAFKLCLRHRGPRSCLVWETEEEAKASSSWAFLSA